MFLCILGGRRRRRRTFFRELERENCCPLQKNIPSHYLGKIGGRDELEDFCQGLFTLLLLLLLLLLWLVLLLSQRRHNPWDGEKKNTESNTLKSDRSTSLLHAACSSSARKNSLWGRFVVGKKIWTFYSVSCTKTVKAKFTLYTNWTKNIALLSVWPDAEIKAAQNFQKLPKNLAMAVFTWKLMFSK